jgi:hypothetical protein
MVEVLPVARGQQKIAMPDWLTSALTFLGNLVGLGKDVQQEKNAPAEQANAQAQTDAQIEAQAEKDVESGNLDQIRKDSAP